MKRKATHHPLAKALIAWFETAPRDLPWRRQRTPYRVWLSEIMLQQTQVKTVVPYFNRFLQRWPAVQDLARASVDDVLREWEGLGYYSRARNLHKAAQSIVADFAGEFPSSAAGLKTLPGIGDYTAGAIASLAFGQVTPAVDGNVVRVFSRLMAKTFDISRPIARRALHELVAAVMPCDKPGVFNEALMELGATVCTPRAPLCDRCPLRRRCAAKKSGRQEQFPRRAKKTPVRELQMAVAVICCAEQVLIVRNPQRGIWAGLWIFPSHPGDGITLRRWLKKEFDLASNLQPAGEPLVHLLTHRRLVLHPYMGALQNAAALKDVPAHAAWVARADLHRYAFPKAHRDLQKRLLAG